MKRLVVTGGPCSGKSTLIDALSRAGFKTAREAAIEVIREGVDRQGLHEFTRWRESQPRAFQLEVDHQQRTIESGFLESDIVFCDRSRIDGVAYLRLAGCDVPASLSPQALENYSIAAVIVLDTLEKFEIREHTGRTGGRDDADRIREALIQTYLDYGHDTHVIYEQDLDTRLDQIIKFYERVMNNE